MTKIEALKKLKTTYEQIAETLNSLPDGADVIGINSAVHEFDSENPNYIQLYIDGELPDMPFSTEYYEDGTPEYSVHLNGVKVLWLGEKKQ